MNRMSSIQDILENEEVKAEYKKALLLNMFKKIVVRINKDCTFRSSIRKLFSQSTNREATVKAIIRNNLNFDLDDDDCKLMLQWFEKKKKKSNQRKPISLDLKEKLYKKQNGICLVCGEPLEKEMKYVHVDHIIPWMLVGDELKDNYQCLCQTCNECKSARTDYMFRNLVKLI